jgi:ERCC4-related helicase
VLPSKLASGLIAIRLQDECHHCQKKHPYKLIMEEYHLHKEAHPHLHRPQILGLTASPVFNLKDAQEKFAALEASLDSIIITARETATEAASYFKKPIERKVFYTKDYDAQFETEFELMLEDLEIWEYVNEDKVRNRIENVKSVSHAAIPPRRRK